MPIHKPDLRLIPYAQLIPSPWNPRKHYDQQELHQLAANIAENGVQNPLQVRIVDEGKKFEIWAGERRYRAVGIARKSGNTGLDDVPCLVQTMDDETFIVAMNFENLQRANLHPMEEAAGFEDLIKRLGWKPEQIAGKMNREVSYVYDRLRLLKLVPLARDLFLVNKFTLEHAVRLARLSTTDQARALDVTFSNYGVLQNCALFTVERDLFDPRQDQEDRADADAPYTGVKAVSVKEFQAWIDTHVRLDLKAESTPQLFPETAKLLQDAERDKRKVVSITHLSQLAPDAKDDKEKTLPPALWRRADGLAGSKRCDRTVLGVVQAGPGRGEDSFLVCTSKTSCEIHWGPEIRERRKREAEREKETEAALKKSGGNAAGLAEKRKQQELRDQERQQKAQRAQRAENERWHVAKPALAAAIADRLKKMPFAQVANHLLNSATSINQDESAEIVKLLPRGKTAEDLVRHIEFRFATDHFKHARPTELVAITKEFGVDARKILDKVPTPLQCVHCGCTDHDPCQLYDQKTYRHSQCTWVSKAPAACSAPACVKAEAIAKKNRTEQPATKPTAPAQGTPRKVARKKK